MFWWPRRREMPGVVLALAALLPAAGACSGSPPAAPEVAASPAGAPDSAKAPVSVAAAPTPAPPPRPLAPLTAVPVGLAGTRPALAVPVIVSSGSPAPQGLDRADVVFEEVTSPTRYLGIFHSQDADRVGPIGRTRPVDPMLLTVVHPAMAYTGGRSGFVRMLQKAPVTDLGYLTHPAAYSRRGAAPYDVFVSTAKLRGLVDSSQAPPQLFRFASTGDSVGRDAKPARQVTIRLPGGSEQTWRFDTTSRRWRRDGGRPAVAPANVVVQVVAYKDVRLDSSNALVPSARVLGDGESFVFSQGTGVRGHWYKRGAKAVTSYVDSAGFPVRLAPGPTWVLLAPRGTTVRTAS